jgi:hypothetical protein
MLGGAFTVIELLGWGVNALLQLALLLTETSVIVVGPLFPNIDVLKEPLPPPLRLTVAVLPVALLLPVRLYVTV